MKIKTNKFLAKQLAKSNIPTYNHTKAIEELNELATVLTQRVNKPTKVSSKKIIEEIGDVRQRLAVLEEIYGKKKIQKRIEYKENKLLGYLKSNKYRKKV